MQDDSVAFVVAYLALINFIASILQGLTTFGDAITLHILWHAMTTAVGTTLRGVPLGSNDVQTITLIVYSRTTVLNAVLFYLNYRQSNRQNAGTVALTARLVLCAMLPNIASSLAGEQLLEYLPQAALKVVFGSVCLVFALSYAALKLYYAQANCRSFRPSASQQSGSMHGVRLLVITGTTAGLAGMTGALTGAGGLPWMVLTLALDLPPAFVKVMFPVSTLPSVYLRYALAVSDGLVRSDILMYHAVSVVFGLFGLLTGNWLGRRVGPQAFNAVVLVLLTQASLVMLLTNVWVMLVLLVLGAIVMVGAWWVEVLPASVPPCGRCEVESPRVYDALHDTEILS